MNLKNEKYKNKSLLGSYWEIEECEDRLVLSSSQKNNISPFLSKLLLSRNIEDNEVNNYLNPIIENQIPNPFLLKDMKNAVSRTIEALKKNEKIGIIADYDVDGSTSASILFNFLKNFNNNILIKTPNRLTEGYGPNLRLIDEMFNEKISIIFTLDCGTTSFDVLDNPKYSSIDIIVIDHHLSEEKLPKVHSVINPNRYDENNHFYDLAAVGVTFLFLMALRKNLRLNNYFKKNNTEPNLLNFLDLVALGTVCDVVNLTKYNRVFVKNGLDIIKSRKNKAISKMIDNANLITTPTASDLGFVIGPQLNAASRIEDSSLPSKLLTTKNDLEIESISRKLLLLNKKRKLIENDIYEEALKQCEHQSDEKFILVYGNNWHNGVLGIIASKLLSKYYKPTLVVSFNGSSGIGSARSINNIDLGNIILEAKNLDILSGGGGHKMAAGFQVKKVQLNKFEIFLKNKLSKFSDILFKKVEKFDSILKINEINNDLLENIDLMEPFGAGNQEPKFIIDDMVINSVKILKDKHLLIFFSNDFSVNLKGICFNCIGTILGDYLLNFKKHKFAISCNVKKDNFSDNIKPQIIIKDIMIID